MYTYIEKNKALELLIKYELQYTKVSVELGYPSKKALRNWYYEYLKYGWFKNEKATRVRFLDEDKSEIINYYLVNGKNKSKTVNHFGYPSRSTFNKWLNEYDKNLPKHCLTGKPVVKYNYKVKKEITKKIIINNISIYKASNELGITPMTLYNWRKKILSKTGETMNINKNIEVIDSKTLRKKYTNLEKKYKDLQVEYDILLKAQEILKKESGISLNELSNKEKTDIAYALRNKYQLNVLLKSLYCAKSTYFYHIKNLNKVDPYQVLRKELFVVFNSNYQSFGYRRLYDHFKNTSLKVSEKVIRRLMKDEGIKVINHKKKKYSSYLGEISPEVDNLLNRNFHADKPNQKWLTDITEFHIPAGKVYLSPVIDCYEGFIVSWTASTSPNARLTNGMINKAIKSLKDDEHPIVHNDRGSHYRWPDWIRILEERGLTRSMSKKGCSPDNSACEGFFGRIKNEFFYNRDWNDISINNFIHLLNKYLDWYNYKRTKRSLNGLVPYDFRKAYYK